MSAPAGLGLGHSCPALTGWAGQVCAQEGGLHLGLQPEGRPPVTGLRRGPVPTVPGEGQGLSGGTAVPLP